MRPPRAGRTLEAPVGRGEDHVHVRFTADVARIRLARAWVVAEAAHAGASAHAQRVVALLASELITNAVVHGPAEGVVDVRVTRDGDRLRVGVGDQAAGLPVLLDPSPSAVSGRGVLLVERLAAAWGVEAAGAGKTVWFEVPLAATPGPAGAP